MKIERLVLGRIEANCYFLTIGGETAVIDPGYRTPALEAKLKEYRNIKYILLTHRHADHLMAAAYVKSDTNALLAISEADKDALHDPDISLSRQLFNEPQEFAKPDIILHDGDLLSLGDKQIKVLATPGHSAGGVCFIVDDVIFSGDTLFKGSAGRTDLPSGDYGQLINSLKTLGSLPGNFTVYPGHGENTDLENERKHNPYFKF